jgi:MFS family permease
MLVYYSTRIFADIGLSAYLSQLLAAVMNTGFAIGTYPLPWTIEKFGRRPIMLWSALVCFISILIFTVMIGLPHPTLATQWTAVAFVIIYNFAFGYGWIGCPWLYGPEVLCLLINFAPNVARTHNKQHSLTSLHNRSPPSNIATSEARPALSASGSSLSSRSLQAVLLSSVLDGESGSGRSLHALSCSSSSISCVLR